MENYKLVVSSLLQTLKENQTVLDLGFQDATDIFSAAHVVKQDGIVVGLNTSEILLEQARKDASSRGMRPPNVSFVRMSPGSLSLPLEPGSVDCVFSSSPTHRQYQTIESRRALWKEVHRVLKHGGRALFDDLAIQENSPQDTAIGSLIASSAIGKIDDTTAFLQSCGFSDITAEIATVPTDLSLSRDVIAVSHTDLYYIHVKKDGIPPADSPPNVLLRWWDAYPSVKSSPPGITATEVAALIRDPDHIPKTTFAVIDVRRNDHAGGHVRGSFNWHAQSFHDNVPAFFKEFENTPKVIFYCQSSNGRGPRCAGWYQDYLDQHPGKHRSQAYVLIGGIKNWLATFAGQEDLVDAD